MWQTVDRQTWHYNSEFQRVWAMKQGIGEQLDWPCDVKDVVVSDEKKLVESILHVKSAIQVYSEVTYTADRLYVNTINADTHSGYLKTLHGWPETYELHLILIQLKTPTPYCTPTCVLGMTLNCIHIFIVTGSFLYWCVMRPASQRFSIHICIYLRILIISYLATFLGTNSLSVLMCRKAVNQSINQSHQRWMDDMQVSSSRQQVLSEKWVKDYMTFNVREPWQATVFHYDVNNGVFTVTCSSRSVHHSGRRRAARLHVSSLQIADHWERRAVRLLPE